MFDKTITFSRPVHCVTCSELVSGTLSSNSIEDGTEIRLVPAVESGVTVCTCACMCRCTYVVIDVYVEIAYLMCVCVLGGCNTF